MATKKLTSTPQNYPRINSPGTKLNGCLDDSKLTPHSKKIEEGRIKEIIATAIRDANSKSRREIINVPADATDRQRIAIYEGQGRKLFKYFKDYSGDPASTAHLTYGKHYREVGVEAFRNQLLQRGRMNSGWRYQFLVVSAARETERFISISDIGSAEGDFNATIAFEDTANYAQPLSLYVSVKNRSNTMGGADWPKAIAALEAVAITDKNRTGPYCCVFGIAMDRGQRYIKADKGGKAQSVNTEIWQSDFFWPFFTNLSYEEVMALVLDVLMTVEAPSDDLPTQADVPDELLAAFGKECVDKGLVDELGNFNDAKKLVSFFCGPMPKEVKKKTQKVAEAQSEDMPRMPKFNLPRFRQGGLRRAVREVDGEISRNSTDTSETEE